jgi:hypothetical protein
MKAATAPGAAIGATIRRNAPHVVAPSNWAACYSSIGIEPN